MLDRFAVQGTFFVVADVCERYPGLIEAIVDSGHEIACHGLHHTCKMDPDSKAPLMSSDEFISRTQQAKRILEGASGGKIIGYRAPNALITGWMIDSLERMGFLYDSSVSVNSLYNKTNSSLAGVSSFPYHPKVGELVVGKERRLIEYPWAFLDLGGFKLPASGGPMLRFIGGGFILQGLMQSLKRGDTVFYFHPIDIATAKFPTIGKGRPFYWMIKGERVEKRIAYILSQLRRRSVWMGTMQDILGYS